MFAAIENTPLRYAWGARGALSKYLGERGVLVEPARDSSGADSRGADSNGADSRGTDSNVADSRGAGPIQAEIWLGAHHGSPSRLVHPEQAGGAQNLAEWIERDPETTLGRYARGLREGDPIRLPFLLKVLAAGTPLSLQVHPSLRDAREGFAAEDAAGIPRDAPNRNYRDPFHKPELVVALSPELVALAGFREFAEVKALVSRVARAAGPRFEPFAHRVRALSDSDSLGALVAWVLGGSPEALAATVSMDAWLAADEEHYRLERANLARIRQAFPEDSGALIALLTNHILLREGESLSITSGTIHAYLEGVGIEIMAASDNVLRGGLTNKHVDVPELLRVLDRAPTAPSILRPERVQAGYTILSGEEPDFRLHRVSGSSTASGASNASNDSNVSGASIEVRLDGPGIALCLAGRAELRGGSGAVVGLERGEAVFITGDEQRLEVTADDLVIASAAAAAGATLPL